MKTTVLIASIIVSTVIANEQKEVNIALETILRFGKNNQQSPGLGIIDKVQNALERIKDDIKVQNGRRSNAHSMTFTDFIAKAAKILKDYDDDDLEDVFNVIGDETRRFINRESELQKLFGSGDVRRHLSQQFDDLKDLHADMLRRHLDTAITAVEDKKHNRENNDLLDIGNFLYIGGDNKLKAALRNLEKLLRSKDVRVENVLKDTLRSLFFDHFSELNDNIKHELVEMAKDYLKAVNGEKDSDKSLSKYTKMPTEEGGYSRKNLYKSKLISDSQKSHMSKVPPIQETKKYVGHKNKRYKYNSITQKNREPVTAYTKLNKFKEITQMLPDKINPLLGSNSDINMTDEKIKDKKSKTVTRKQKKSSSFSDSKQPKLPIKVSKELKNTSSGFMLLTGGQRTQDIDLRGHSSSHETYELSSSDKTEEEPETRKTSTGRNRTAAYISVERFLANNKNYHLKENEKEGNETTVTPNTSDDGLGIESFENELTMENKVMRKYIENDGLKIDKKEVPFNVKNMIRNIEKQIEDVKEQVNYVKNLTNVESSEEENATNDKPTNQKQNVTTDKSKEPIKKNVNEDKSNKLEKNITINTVDNSKKKHQNLTITDHKPRTTDDKPSKRQFRATDSYNSLSKPKKKNNYLNSDSLERDNEAFFSRDVSEIINETDEKPSLRAHDTYSDKPSTTTQRNNNYTTKAVALNTTPKSTLNIVKENKVNDSKTIHSPNLGKDNKTLSNLTKAEGNNYTTDYKTNNVINFETSTVNVKLNEIETNAELNKSIARKFNFNPLVYKFKEEEYDDNLLI